MRLMSVKNGLKITVIICSVCAFSVVALFFSRGLLFKRIAQPGWRIKFLFASSGPGTLPEAWKLEKKPGTRSALFSVMTSREKGGSFLHMTADSGSASLITRADNVDLRKTPILRWRWRAITLPVNADGRVRAKDDQAIGLYVGSGNMFNNKSISYRWDTDTPKLSEGKCVYGAGTIKVKWFTLRDKEDAAGKWVTEERNAAEDFRKAWGFYPDKIYLSVSCNSQYTKSQAAADLAWIEFARTNNKVN